MSEQEIQVIAAQAAKILSRRYLKFCLWVYGVGIVGFGGLWVVGAILERREADEVIRQHNTKIQEKFETPLDV